MNRLRKWIALLLVSVAILSASLQGAASMGLSSDDTSIGSDDLPGSSPLDDDDEDDEDEDDNEGRDNDDDDEDEPDDDDDERDNDDDDERDNDDDDEDEDDDDFRREEREVKVELEDDEVTIKLESKTQERKDEVKVRFQGREAQLKVSFEKEAAEGEEVEMRITFRRVVEFNDTDGDGAFSPIGDEMVQAFAVEQLTLTRLSLEPFVIDGSEGRRVDVSYAFPGFENSTFGLVFWIFGNFTFLNGVPVAPSEVKIDILLTNFPFREDNSSVAVDLMVKTEFEVEAGTVPSLDEVIARGEEFAAFFRWAPNATVDGQDVDVGSTIVRESLEAERELGEAEFEKKVHLFLAYPRGEAIVHDPTVGVMAIPPLITQAPPALGFAIGLATALLLVLGVWVLSRRRH